MYRQFTGNPLLRHVYDLYGEEGLKRGTPTPNGYVQPYAYHGDYMKTYAYVVVNFKLEKHSLQIGIARCFCNIVTLWARTARTPT